MRLSRALQFAAGIALAAVGLAIFFHNVDVHKLRGELLSCNPGIVAVCVACTVLTILLRALRWKIMLPDAQQAHKRNLFPGFSQLPPYFMRYHRSERMTAHIIGPMQLQ